MLKGAICPFENRRAQHHLGRTTLVDTPTSLLTTQWMGLERCVAHLVINFPPISTTCGTPCARVPFLTGSWC